ncbi:hypothetical protein H072_819 [Dactylellina haptotyla CBS 200.50]|uniref:NmrA-like domain-containing protein n=1 Tax=Dactylellina haptotyla (strain CBS 200.50) TaxID=1284197 RepID=S8AQD4_DACHA|nr:hypothetical protein H072_819 [Dactylellina haptotyla CBS 200.50]
MSHARRQRVALCGSGGLGRYVAEAILAANEWDLVILSRYEQPHLSQQGIRVRQVDYNDPEHLRSVLVKQRVHTVISVIPDPYVQLALIDACVSAGVLRFIPSEFEASPSQQPLYTSGGRDRLTVRRHLEEVSEHLESTVFACGLFMEYFAPGGWNGCGGGNWNDGTFLIDLKRKKAVLPIDAHREPSAIVCVTSAMDVAQFVAGALNLSDWGPELKMFGERLRLGDLLAISQEVREREFKVKYLTDDDIDYNLSRAVAEGDWKSQCELQTMQSINNHEYDVGHRNLNAIFPGIRPISFTQFLRTHWRASNH